MIYYVDGFVIGKNPSQYGGGFTIVNEQNLLVYQKTFAQVGFTNNEGELGAITYAAYLASSGDTIITDSECALHWCRSGRCRKRPDLSSVATQAKHWIAAKSLHLEWKSRNENLAGKYNENMHREIVT